jgi:hypothetical protein
MKSITKTKRKLADGPFLHRTVQYRLAMFLQQYPPREFNRQFRDMFIDYLIYRHGGINYRINREIMIEGVWDLMRVLDEAEIYWEFREMDDIIDEYNGAQAT